MRRGIQSDLPISARTPHLEGRVRPPIVADEAKITREAFFEHVDPREPGTSGGSDPPPARAGRTSLLRHVAGLYEERVVGLREGGGRSPVRASRAVGAQVARRVTPPRLRFKLTHRVQPAEHHRFCSEPFYLYHLNLDSTVLKSKIKNLIV